jgi:isoleucyl-tRNA synthetase
LPENEKEKSDKAFKIYPADFVTTEDGTGIVHTAVMYGQDDFALGTEVGLPKHHLVNENGTFKEETGFLSGKFVKDQETDIEIIKDLAHRGLLLKKEKYEHSYPHCWRCKTALIYYARDSWYIRMSELRDKLLKENEDINWEPAHLKNGRFGEWLSEVKDWAISRERYWGTPLPVWQCNSCEKREVIGSFDELYLKSVDNTITKLILLRHGESEKNVPEKFDSGIDTYPLTLKGKGSAEIAGEELKKTNIDAVYFSPVRRARETAEIIGKALGKDAVADDRLWEIKNGEWEGKRVDDPSILDEKIAYNNLPDEKYYETPRGKTGENWKEVEERMSDFAKEILEKHKGKTVAVISHEGPLMVLMRHLKNLSIEEIVNLWEERRDFHRGLLGGYAEPTSIFIDNRTGKEIDPHRPYIDDIKLSCECGGEMARVKEVMDVWFDSGAMPFAQDHYPFKNKEWLDEKGFPADFISEAIDQTRGWFYTLHAIGTLLGKGKAYKNIISFSCCHLFLYTQ